MKKNNTQLNNVILLSGRVGSGKTEMLIAYANLYPKATLFISNESSKEKLCDRGLNECIVYSDSLDNLNISLYETVCIDYLELFGMEAIKKFISNVVSQNKRIIVASQMKRSGEINNVFEMI